MNTINKPQSLRDFIREKYKCGWLDVADSSFGWQIVAPTKTLDEAFALLWKLHDVSMSSRWDFLTSELMGDLTAPYHYMIGALYRFMGSPDDEAVRDEWISAKRNWALSELQGEIRYAMKLTGASDIEQARYNAQQRDLHAMADAQGAMMAGRIP